jgi:phosphoheptose isomerase
LRNGIHTASGDYRGAARVSHIVVDRDGVLNVEAPAGGYVTRPEDWHWIPGSLEALAMLARAGVRVSVATNQSGVGRGLMTRDQLDAIHARMRRELAASGGRVDAIFVCTHAPGDGCSCRKPMPGLVLDAVAASGVAASETLVVGDDVHDLEAAQGAGVPCALVLTGKGRDAARGLARDATPVFDDLNTLVRSLLGARAPDVPGTPVAAVPGPFDEHLAVVKEAADRLPPLLDELAGEFDACFARGNKLLACGNGGSAADAEHLVAELVGRFREERPGLPAITLTAGSATMTALANDYGYERVFARQVEALAGPGDILLAISTSGRSASVLEAARTARARGCRVVAFTGADGGPLAALADVAIAAPSTVTARIQEVHGLCIHAICAGLDERRRPRG